ncbi:MAG: DUF1192 domain-containing protein [Pseudomonadota bacterium]
MDWDEPQKQPTSTVQLGEALDTISIEELHLRIDALRNEIKRCEDAIQSKQAQRDAAHSVFKT